MRLSVILKVFLTISNLGNSVSASLLGKSECDLHIFHSTTFPASQLLETLDELTTINVAYSLVEHPGVWGRRHNYLEVYLPRFISSNCLIFLLLDSSPQDILTAVEHSGYFVNKQALFVAYLTTATYHRVFLQNVEWPERLFTTDVTLMFLIEQEELMFHIFCYFCPNKILPAELPSDVNRGSLTQLVDSVNKDAMGNPIYLPDALWYKDRLSAHQCTPYDPIAFRNKHNDAFTCFPYQKLFLRALVSKFNVTFQTSQEVKPENFWTNSVFSSKHNMIILPGPMGSIGPRRNYSKEMTLNMTKDKLIYCIDKREAHAGILSMLGTLIDPFQNEVWISLISITILVIIIVRPDDPVSLASVLVGHGYLPRLNKSHSSTNRRTRIGLVILWSVLMSTSISHLYDAILTADMLVPLPEYVIPTFEELILKGYKIGYMDNNPLSDAWAWYERNFNKPSIHDRRNKSFEHIKFDSTMPLQVIEKVGKLAIFKNEASIGESLEVINSKLFHNSDIVCHVVKEPIIEVLLENCHVLFHLSSEFVNTIQQILESGIFNSISHMKVWQSTFLASLKRHQTQPEESIGFKPTGFTYGSKIPVIFLMFASGILLSSASLILEVAASLCTLINPQRRRLRRS